MNRGLNHVELIVLGSGTCVPSLRRAGPAACLLAGGKTLLVDTAAGTLRQLVRAGLSYDQVDVVLYTHFHPDHVGEFVPFVFATGYAPGYQRSTPVTIIAPRGFVRFYEALKGAYGHWIELEPWRLEIEELPNDCSASKEFPPLTIRGASTRHASQSLAYRVEVEGGRAVVFSGDTDFSPELIELAKGADLFVCECAAPEGHKVPGHLTPSEAGRMAEEAGVGRLLLTHFYPLCDEHDLLTPCRQIYSGPVLLAEDFMRVVL